MESPMFGRGTDNYPFRAFIPGCEYPEEIYQARYIGARHDNPVFTACLVWVNLKILVHFCVVVVPLCRQFSVGLPLSFLKFAFGGVVVQAPLSKLANTCMTGYLAKWEIFVN